MLLVASIDFSLLISSVIFSEFSSKFRSDQCVVSVFFIRIVTMFFSGRTSFSCMGVRYHTSGFMSRSFTCTLSCITIGIFSPLIL